MTPIPSSELPPIQCLPPEITYHIGSYLPSIAEGPDEYSSVVLAWREICGFVRSQRFKSVTITGEKDPNLALPLKLDLITKIISGAPSVAGCVRHISVTYNEAISAQQIDPYPHLYGLLNLCRNIQSASFENVRPSRYTTDDPTVSPVIVIPGLKPSATITELDVHNFDGTAPELCNFLSEFPNLVELGMGISYREVDKSEPINEDLTSVASPRVINSDNEDVDFAPMGIKPFPNIRVLRCQSGAVMESSEPHDTFMDLLGSSYTIFPGVEKLIYSQPDGLARVQQLLDQLKMSLQSLELGPVKGSWY